MESLMEQEGACMHHQRTLSEAGEEKLQTITSPLLGSAAAKRQTHQFCEVKTISERSDEEGSLLS
jgi:hypothetical protein